MIGVDTNVLLRLAVADDAAQLRAIRHWMAEHAPDGRLFVNRVVLVEAAWTLKSVYGYAGADIALFVDALLDNAAFELEDAAQVADALSMFESGSADFPDCLIAAGNLGRCNRTITFDKSMRDLPGVKVL